MSCASGFLYPPVGRLILKSKYTPYDAVAQQGDVEVDQQSDFPPSQTKVRQQLRFMDGSKAVDNFDFDNRLISDNQVNPVTAVQSQPLVYPRQRSLQDKRQLSNLKFTAQTLDIG